MAALDSPTRLHVPASLDWLGRWVGNHPRFWIALGNFESKLLAADIESVAIEKPVYICGLARAGSTLLLEMLAEQANVTTHRYQDFPFLFTPYWWNTLLKLMPWRDGQKRERAHGDRIMINIQSPEAMEEMLWMAFFPHLHSADEPDVLDASARRTDFDRFYQDHIRKLLLARKATRYVAKGNYNVTRLAYLHSLFPDARFVIPIREPASHIVSLMRQHARFCAAGKKDPRAVRHMSLTGHFEFGLNRVPIHTGDTKRLQEIEEAWQRGEEVRGWALYWDMIYGFIHRQLAAYPALTIPFEQLCTAPHDTIHALFEHCGLAADPAHIDALAANVRMPDYYTSPLSTADAAMIRDITGKTATRFGY